MNDNVIKENLFNKRVTDVRRQTQFNMDARAAVEYLQNERQAGSQAGSQPGSQIGGFIQPQQTSYSQSGVFQRPDVVVRELSEDEIDQKAFYDTTTPAYNLRFLLRSLHDEFLRCQTFNRPVTIMVVAIHNFKNLGIDYGALALDSVISTAAKAILASCRPVDMVGRFMEDRFIVVCPETDVENVVEIAEKVRLTFETIAIPHQWHTIRFQANIGLAQFPGHGTDVESFIGLADYAADSVAEGGGNSIMLAPNM